LIEFFFEDQRAGLLALFAIFCTTLGVIYRFFIVGHGLKYLLWINPIPMDHEIHLAGLKFVEVGPQSPEQYEVFYDDRMIGYVRYRFGCLSAQYPDVGVECVFERELEHQTGQMTDREHGRWLPKIARRLRHRLERDLAKLDSNVHGETLNGLRFEPILGPGTERYFVYRGEAILGFVEHRKGVLIAAYPDEGFENLLEEVISQQDRRLTKTERETWFPKIADLLIECADRDAGSSTKV
jgi:hypothetical protein